MDRSGILGMPFRLAAAVLIVSMCVPAMAAALDGFGGSVDTGEAEGTAREIAGTAAELYYDGAGSSATLRYSLPEGCQIAVGGEGGNAFSVRVLNGGTVKWSESPSHPAVRFIGSVVLSDEGMLRLVCENDGLGCGIRGEAA